MAVKASGIRDGAATAKARAINVTLRPGCGKPGATTHAGIMKLSHDPLKTEGETRRYTLVLAKRRYKWSYDTAKLPVA